VALAEIAFTHEQIQRRVRELAGALREDLGDARPLLVSVLKGSVVFLADLVRYLPGDCDVDFMSISRYSRDVRTGVVQIVKDLEEPLEGRHVVIVEDIVDTGLSLSYLVRNLATRDPASLRICTLIDKRVMRIAELSVDYVGFDTDRFLIGYGLDLQGRYRNLVDLLAVTDMPRLAADPDALLAELFPGGVRARPNPRASGPGGSLC
jgi:hypoxanthine phosphoribosyltransferase